MIITAQMIRDRLALSGPCSLYELTSDYELNSNRVMTLLLDLAAMGEAAYCEDTGKWFSKVKLCG